MMILKIILLVFFLTSAQVLLSIKCTCDELQETDCGKNTKCSWSNDTCSDAIPVCPNYYDQLSCDKIKGCSWNNSNICDTFTECSDYTLPLKDKDLCYQKDPSCVPETLPNLDGTITCKVGTLDQCSDVTNKYSCSFLFQDDGLMCYYQNSEQKCITQDISQCASITNENLCNSVGCVFSNSSCFAPSCATSKKENCTIINYNSRNIYQVCIWENDTCNNATDLSSLDASNCYNNTVGTYAWKNGSCSACTGQPILSEILQFLAISSIIYI